MIQRCRDSMMETREGDDKRGNPGSETASLNESGEVSFRGSATDNSVDVRAVFQSTLADGRPL